MFRKGQSMYRGSVCVEEVNECRGDREESQSQHSSPCGMRTLVDERTNPLLNHGTGSSDGCWETSSHLMRDGRHRRVDLNLHGSIFISEEKWLESSVTTSLPRWMALLLPLSIPSRLRTSFQSIPFLPIPA